MAGDLSIHAHNRFSQNGEDGVLAALFGHLGVRQGYFVEFGAWDGMKHSNAYALLEQGWTGCYIEGDPDRFSALQLNVPQATITKICRYVQPSGSDSLDSILEAAGAPPWFELLSIDIDSDDLAVWRGLRSFRPLCVVIEYNPTIPFDLRFENPPGKNWGNAPLSICEFADGAGYRLVAVTATNLVFLDALSGRDTRTIRTIRLDEVEPQVRSFWGYDGSLIMRTPGSPEPSAPGLYRVPWVGAVVAQPLPARLRRYDDTSAGMRGLLRMLLTARSVLTRPVSAARALRACARSHRD